MTVSFRSHAVMTLYPLGGVCVKLQLLVYEATVWKKIKNKKSLHTNLSICKDGGVVSFKAAFDQSLGAVLVDGFLLRVYVKDMIVGEGLVLAQDHLWLPRHHKGADVAALDLLFGQLRTDPGR